MPENQTLKEATKRLEKLVLTAEKMGCSLIASLWLTEAKIILKALKEHEHNDEL